MALSDFCSNFVEDVRKSQGDLQCIAAAVDEFAKGVYHYASPPPWDYDVRTIEALRCAIAEVRQDQSAETLDALVALAKAVQEFYDTPPDAFQ